ncbi:hypothetical protein K0M31_014986 [Melipona bicolor]|uniref:Uncharacterized protein n=1 Tax=Melipona bicolor TaxID=60889 RepID=A0AA40FGN6_9HYME|nr:hypothetical protein K0M31_014986 [Melipona bicolor]
MFLDPMFLRSSRHPSTDLGLTCDSFSMITNMDYILRWTITSKPRRFTLRLAEFTANEFKKKKFLSKRPWFLSNVQEVDNLRLKSSIVRETLSYRMARTRQR